MKILINFSQERFKKRKIVYLPLLVLLFASIAGNLYLYKSVNADISRYNAKLSELSQRFTKIKETTEESFSKEEKELLVKEASFINTFIKGRHLYWSALIAQLENEIVPNISLLSLTPRVSKDKVKIDVRGVGKNLETITRFIDRLELSPSFQSVFMPRYSDTEIDGEKLLNFNMELEYVGK